MGFQQVPDLQQVCECIDARGCCSVRGKQIGEAVRAALL